VVVAASAAGQWLQEAEETRLQALDEHQALNTAPAKQCKH